MRNSDIMTSLYSDNGRQILFVCTLNTYWISDPKLVLSFDKTPVVLSVDKLKYFNFTMTTSIEEKCEHSRSPAMFVPVLFIYSIHIAG